MKKPTFLFAALLCLASALHAASPGETDSVSGATDTPEIFEITDSGEHAAFRFDDKGGFTVMQITDLHYNGSGWQSDHVPGMLTRLIEQERPDLIVMTGDLIYKRPGDEPMREICGVIAATGIPYAVTLGNHDAEQGLSQAELYALIRTLPGCVNARYNAPEERQGDFVIPVLSAEGTREEARIYVMDSNDYNADDHSYKGFTPEQVAWYRATCAEAARSNQCNATGLIFFHVPLKEYAEAYAAAPAAGFRLERECPPRDNTGMFRALADGGEIVGVFAGHDHSNDYIAEKEGIALGYGRYSGGYGEYQDLLSGVRMIRLKEGERGFETWVRMANGREKHRMTFPSKKEN